VLDGVAAPSMKVTIDVWPSRELALTAVLDACAQSPACRSAHPDLPATLERIRDRLGPKGRDVAVTDPRTGAVETQHLTFDHVLAALQPLTYAPELSALLPEVIGAVDAGNYGPLFAGAMLVAGDLAQQMNNALHYSVTCTEDVPRITASDIERALATARSKTLATQALAVCDVWPKGEALPDAAKPVQSDVPVLILSGGLDPVTPPANGTEVSKTLSASRHIIARGYGHIVSPHACGPRLIAAFIDDPTFATLPAACVEHFEKSTRPPLWPDRLGARS